MKTRPITETRHGGTTWFVDEKVKKSGDGKTPETAFKTFEEAEEASFKSIPK